MLKRRWAQGWTGEGVLVLASDAGCVQAGDRLGVDAHGADPREVE